MIDRQENYRSASIKYLENGLHLLEEGDADKAGEMLWGSLAAAVKAVAARRDSLLRSHRDIRRYARALGDEVNDPTFFGDFMWAEHLHANFYEVFLEPEDVQPAVPTIRRRVTQLLEMAGQEAS